MNNRQDRTGIRRVVRAWHYSRQGIAVACRQEAAFRQELFLFTILIPLAFWVGETAEQRLLLIGPCVLVIVVELLNSAVEAVVDRIGRERHELSGQAKDMGSAAVLCSLFLVLLSWLLICWQRFIS